MKELIIRLIKRLTAICAIFFFCQYLHGQYSSATGFFITNSGIIMTCHHVIERADTIFITGILGDYSIIRRASVIYFNKEIDIALLQIDKGDIDIRVPYLIRDDDAELGESVFTLGYPLVDSMGQEIKLTTGVISSSAGFKGDLRLFQVSTPVQPGNSGGPLFDDKGRIIGVINAKHLAAENVSYAVKSTIIKNLIKEYINKKDIPIKNELQNLSLVKQVDLARKYVIYILSIDYEKNSHNISAILSSMKGKKFEAEIISVGKQYVEVGVFEKAIKLDLWQKNDQEEYLPEVGSITNMIYSSERAIFLEGLHGKLYQFQSHPDIFIPKHKPVIPKVSKPKAYRDPAYPEQKINVRIRSVIGKEVYIVTRTEIWCLTPVDPNTILPSVSDKTIDMLYKNDLDVRLYLCRDGDIKELFFFISKITPLSRKLN